MPTPRKSRIGLRPPARPKLGSYWKALKIYDASRPKSPKFVAVIATERKYARMGMQTCFVTFIPAAEYATKVSTPRTIHLDQDIFMSCFREVGAEELGHDLGLEILAYYG
jgi:hypothetical protein